MLGHGIAPKYGDQMRAFVGVTDWSWYQFLAARPSLTEVNFWRPSGRGFGAIGTGEPFLFKTHSPHNRLVGAGFLSGAARLRLSEAWEYFGESNGVASLEEMRQVIGRYRKQEVGAGEDPEIGCILLRDVNFVGREMALAPPHDFASNIVMGKKYDLGSPEGSHIEEALAQLLVASGLPAGVVGPVFGDPRLSPTRVGQRAFKLLLLDAYQRRCGITGARITPTLDAAHIRPVGGSEGGQNTLSNGLLLRSDVHRMFDRGYLGLDPARRTIHVSPRLRADYGNGEEFYKRVGEPLMTMPDRRADRPDRDALEWHMDVKFLVK